MLWQAGDPHIHFCWNQASCSFIQIEIDGAAIFVDNQVYKKKLSDNMQYLQKTMHQFNRTQPAIGQNLCFNFTIKNETHDEQV